VFYDHKDEHGGGSEGRGWDRYIMGTQEGVDEIQNGHNHISSAAPEHTHFGSIGLIVIR